MYKTISFEEYQKQLMESFKTINDFFIINNIKWWAHSGTLLGAVRNKNLIEWDDDVDMTMTINDWSINKEKICSFLETIGWEAFDSMKIASSDVTRFFSKEKIIVEYNGEKYITKIFIDVMISVPKEKITPIKRKVWSWFNQYNFIFSARYRLIPYYGWFGNEIKKIGWFKNFLVFLQKILLYIFTFWIPITKKVYLKKKNYYSKNVAMFYNYDNNGVIYNINKINTKVKFGDTEIFVNDDYIEELNIWFGKEKWKELPPEWNRVPHHLMLTKLDGKNDEKYKISPYIIL